MDYEQTIIAGNQYQSWLQDTSHILLRGKKRKVQTSDALAFSLISDAHVSLTSTFYFVGSRTRQPKF